ncbi:anti-sigma regulatory factor (Ser/Thr protein kinase) [Nocardiopsis terrae]|uniref:Anti-sigma regulatory factor (Ser/Thr protein kinase) n=1 Tax=Nocardiopsis terrae TaxID=372655 RepID=A0ABR9HQ00_9ACTN|nr:ATP-binding protein [Nocardiopsis terrae]MBE1460920.1 anti-sigma regulatory factor (Ser/Thr protein kinase) [Nocardiopsis terrae]
MSGDNTAYDDGEPRGPRKIERSVVLPYVPESVTRARQGMSADLRAMAVCADRIDDAALILSELVSNALRHASPLPEDTVGVSWRGEVDPGDPTGAWLEISVRDGGSTTMPRVARPSVSGLGGRGLGIVQTLAGRWGTEMDATTTTVWAVLEISAQDPADLRHGTVTALPVAGREPADGDSTDVFDLDLDLRVQTHEPAWGALL